MLLKMTETRIVACMPCPRLSVGRLVLGARLTRTRTAVGTTRLQVDDIGLAHSDLDVPVYAGEDQWCNVIVLLGQKDCYEKI